MIGSRLGLEVGSALHSWRDRSETRRPHQYLLLFQVLEETVKGDGLPSRQNSRLVGPSRCGKSWDVGKVGEIKDAGSQTWVVPPETLPLSIGSSPTGGR